MTVVDEATGAEKKRYVNKDRRREYGPVTVMYSDSGVGLAHEHSSGIEPASVRTEPTDVVAQISNSMNSSIQKALTEVTCGFHSLARGILNRLPLRNLLSALFGHEPRS